MKARALFFQGALAGALITALVFTAGWLLNDHAAAAGELQFQRGQLDSYYLPDVTDDRCTANTYRDLLMVVPASILALWFVVSWLIFGRESVRLQTLKSHLLMSARG